MLERRIATYDKTNFRKRLNEFLEVAKIYKQDDLSIFGSVFHRTALAVADMSFLFTAKTLKFLNEQITATCHTTRLLFGRISCTGGGMLHTTR